jgi:hypothetical protein
VKTDSELRYTDLEVAFELVRRAVAQSGVAAVEVEVYVEVVGHLQQGFFEAGKCAAAGQQFSFECAPARFGLGIIVGVARPAIASQCLGFFDTCPASRASILTTAVGVNNQAGSWLA